MNVKMFSVWIDNNEQWDADHIDPPAWCGDATSPQNAAERAAADVDDRHVALIVRDDEAQTYRRFELVRDWTVVVDCGTTLESLCAP